MRIKKYFTILEVLIVIAIIAILAAIAIPNFIQGRFSARLNKMGFSADTQMIIRKAMNDIDYENRIKIIEIYDSAYEDYSNPSSRKFDIIFYEKKILYFSRDGIVAWGIETDNDDRGFVCLEEPIDENKNLVKNNNWIKFIEIGGSSYIRYNMNYIVSIIPINTEEELVSFCEKIDKSYDLNNE